MNRTRSEFSLGQAQEATKYIPKEFPKGKGLTGASDIPIYVEYGQISEAQGPARAEDLGHVSPRTASIDSTQRQEWQCSAYFRHVVFLPLQGYNDYEVSYISFQGAWDDLTSLRSIDFLTTQTGCTDSPK